MFRSHPPFNALPAGNCSLRKGPSPLLPPCLQTRNYISQKPAERTRGTTIPRRPGRRALACFPPAGGGVILGGVSEGPARHAPVPSPISTLRLVVQPASPRRHWWRGHRSFCWGVAYAHFLPGGGARVPRRRAELTLGGVWALRSGSAACSAWSPNRKAGPPLTPLRWRP